MSVLMTCFTIRWMLIVVITFLNISEIQCRLWSVSEGGRRQSGVHLSHGGETCTGSGQRQWPSLLHSPTAAVAMYANIIVLPRSTPFGGSLQTTWRWRGAGMLNTCLSHYASFCPVGSRVSSWRSCGCCEEMTSWTSVGNWRRRWGKVTSPVTSAGRQVESEALGAEAFTK